MNYLEYKGSKELTDLPCGGNMERTRQGLSLFLRDTLATPSRKGSILLFGYPGAGKSSLVESALYEVCSGIASPPDFVRIHCHLFASQHHTSSDLLKSWGQLQRQWFTAIPLHSRVLVIDEIDGVAFDRQRVGDSVRPSLCYDCMALLDSLPEGLVVLAVTNFPDIIDDAVESKLGKKLYLPLPDQSAVKVMLEGHLDPTDASRVLDVLVVEIKTIDFVFNARPLAEGMGFAEIRGFVDGKSKRIQVSSNPQQVALATLSGGSYPTRAKVDAYEKKYSSFIKSSELLLRTYGLP